MLASRIASVAHGLIGKPQLPTLSRLLSYRAPCDGNTAAALVAYYMSDSAFIYPITPSSPIAELCDQWYLEGKKNAFNESTVVTQLQSEAGASASLHGALATGALASSFTSSQGLLLMYPNMFEIAGELLPGVLHVAMRAIGMQSSTIYEDHSDAMAMRETGWCQLISGSVQEVMDFACISHASALQARLPFLHGFEGFRVSHEVNTIEVLEESEMKEMMDVDAIKAHQARAISPEIGGDHGNFQPADIYMTMTEYNQQFYQQAPSVVQANFDKFAKMTGRQYKLFDYTGHPEAEHVVVVMGSAANTVASVVKHMNDQGAKCGVVQVRLFRPFSIEHLQEVLPASVKKMAVLDRTLSWGATGEPLKVDTIVALRDRDIQIVGGRYGIGGREFTQGMAKAVLDNIMSDTPKDRFTVGINDDLMHSSLDYAPLGVSTLPEGTRECLFWGMGADGTVGANKTAIKLISKHGDKFGQAHFEYSAHKSGGLTMSHLRFGDEPINAPYRLQAAHYVACHQTGYFRRYDTKLTERLGQEGTFVMNTPWHTLEDMEANLSNNLKRDIAQKKVHLYNIDANEIAERCGMPNKINMVMQAVFFGLSQVLPEDKVQDLLDAAIEEDYGKFGKDIIEANQKATRLALEEVKEFDYPASWADLPEDEVKHIGDYEGATDFVKKILEPIYEMRGEDVPMSDCVYSVGGKMPHSLSKLEKRGLAENVPHWNADQCSLQCNTCAFMCPHSVLRPFFVPPDVTAPEDFETIDSMNPEGFGFRIQVSPYDCTGCGVCSTVCPVEAIEMRPFLDEVEEQGANWEFATTLDYLGPEYALDMKKRGTIHGSQLHQPLLEFNGACAGCAEPTYVKLITQMFGEQMMISNASGCSSVWGGTYPWCVWTVNHEGHGPSFSWSLFEDCAEFGFGEAIALKTQRIALRNLIDAGIAEGKASGALKDALVDLTEDWMHLQNSKRGADAVKAALAADTESDPGFVQTLKEKERLLSKKTMWIYAGDGWANDIGFGGLDHVLASGEDVNIMVLDSEVYSNTGGQSSKATPRSAVTLFQAHGKNTGKKDLGQMAMTYRHAYVASIAVGANPQHALKVLQEAEAFPGPSLIQAYCPCIAHGVPGGLGNSVDEQKGAVDSGYWLLYRYDPRLEAEGKNPLQLDSKPKLDKLPAFIEGENRFKQLKLIDEDLAAKKHGLLIDDLTKRWSHYSTLAGKDKKSKKSKK